MNTSSLLDAIQSLFTLQRWNFLPRVETWVEAENVAYSTHIGYALAREQTSLNEQALEKFLIRSLLKSFNKHGLSDVPHRTRKVLENVAGEGSWEKIVVKQAKDTAKLFPRKIRSNFLPFLDGTYENALEIEDVMAYVQMQVALSECNTNSKIYDYYHCCPVNFFRNLVIC